MWALMLCMSVSQRLSRGQYLHVNFDSDELEYVTKYKFAGVFLDAQPNCNSHISHMANKISKMVSVLKTRQVLYLTVDTSGMLYNCHTIVGRM